MSDEIRTLRENFSLSVLQKFEYELRVEKSRQVARALNLIARYSLDFTPLGEELLKTMPRDRSEVRGHLTRWDELKILLWSP